ncbi:CoA transferase, partial [Klebsiella pneumoniae]|uniref:CoA transferase n=1 Tax=Klebsiella pneumoniae TaxID=573 RepID=UPI0027322226
WGFMHAGPWKNARGVNALDGAAHFYTTYECADGKYLSVGSIEPQFYQTLLQGCGLDVPEMTENYRHRDAWQPGRQALAEVFRRKTRDE